MSSSFVIGGSLLSFPFMLGAIGPPLLSHEFGGLLIRAAVDATTGNVFNALHSLCSMLT